jgi:hypothetical protein
LVLYSKYARSLTFEKFYQALAAAAKLVGAKLIGVDLDHRCKEVYAMGVGSIYIHTYIDR